jgi:glutathione synthase/RimK-type ligase-like ATP-grasp enzyme
VKPTPPDESAPAMAAERASLGKARELVGSPAVALVSARAAHALDEDLPPLIAAFAAAGAHAEIADWDDPEVDWARYDLALLRSAWDYTERLPQFLAWVERVAALTRLQNPVPVVRWNSDKHYLLDLARAQLPVVPTRIAAAGSAAQPVLEEFLARYDSAELVVKPTVGAGSRDARRHDRAARGEILAHMQPLLDAGRSVMLQPYLASVDRDGETALMFIDGRFSHAIRKGALLPAGAPATSALFAAEDIRTRAPGADELAVAEQVMAQLPFGPLLYGRVDLIRDDAGRPCVLELELTEPSLYVAYEPPAAARFVAAALSRLR